MARGICQKGRTVFFTSRRTKECSKRRPGEDPVLHIPGSSAVPGGRNRLLVKKKKSGVGGPEARRKLVIMAQILPGADFLKHHDSQGKK